MHLCWLIRVGVPFTQFVLPQFVLAQSAPSCILQPMTFQSGQIIILNGTPRSGKSSIIAVIQDTFDGVWMNLGVDRFMAMTPTRYQPGMGLRPGSARSDLEPLTPERANLELLVPTLYYAMYDAIAAHSRRGLNVVVDVGHHDAYATPLGILPACARILIGLPVLFVGVRCPVEIIMARRRATGWNADDPVEVVPPPVLRWQREAHIPGIYDLEVDTSILSPVECAVAIRARLDHGPTPTAFSRLAQM
jgi:chloramphenicol 3-O phosphotransferase